MGYQRTFEFSIGTPGTLHEIIEEAPLADAVASLIYEIREVYQGCDHADHAERIIEELECLDDSVSSWNRVFDGLEYSVVRVSHSGTAF